MSSLSNKNLSKYFVALTLLALPGCGFSYIVKSGYHQLKILNRRVPIKEALDLPHLSVDEKKKLNLAIEIHNFCHSKLGLKKTNNYSSFVQLDNTYVTYVLRVAHFDQLKAHQWWFPIVGSVPYKGYPTKQEALEEGKGFSAKKYDTYVRGVAAYSTLGWFDDPILSSMLLYSEHGLVDVIIHETVHATLFFKGQVDFNERLANFLATKGTALFYRSQEGTDSTTLKKIAAEDHDEKLFSSFITDELKQLKDWYKIQSQPIAPELKKERIAKIQSNFNHKISSQMKTKRYLNFTKAKLNNASLLSYSTYLGDLSLFEAVYQKLDRNFNKTLKFFIDIPDPSQPEAAMKDLIRGKKT